MFELYPSSLFISNATQVFNDYFLVGLRYFLYLLFRLCDEAKHFCVVSIESFFRALL